MRPDVLGSGSPGSEIQAAKSGGGNAARLGLRARQAGARRRGFRRSPEISGNGWAWMAALGLARQLGVVSPSYAVYRRKFNAPLSGEHGELLLRSVPYQVEYSRLSTCFRPSRLRLYPDVFLRIRLICPPPEEQSAIVAFVLRGSAKVSRVSGLVGKGVATLRECRTRPIADVVTGKLDVRDAAAQLPEVHADDERGEPIQPEFDLRPRNTALQTEANP